MWVILKNVELSKQCTIERCVIGTTWFLCNFFANYSNIVCIEHKVGHIFSRNEALKKKGNLKKEEVQ